MTILAKKQVYSLFSIKLSLSFAAKTLSLSQTKRNNWMFNSFSFHKDSVL